MEFKITGGDISPEELFRITMENPEICFSDEAVLNMTRSRETIEKLVAGGKIIYGVNTGFGKLCDKVILPSEATATLPLEITFPGGMGFSIIT